MTHCPDPRAPQTAAAPGFDSGFCAVRARRLILIAAILGSSMSFIDGTVVAIAIPAIRGSLGASLTEVTWINNAYMLISSALILVGGAAGDRFGLARVFAGGIVVFILASLACAVAPGAEFLIWARAAQGFGAALMIPGSLAIIARAYPEEDRGRAIGIWAAASALTTSLGPIVGGVALSLGGPDMWRWIFAVNLPIGLVALWLIQRAVEEDRSQPDRGLDLLGAALAVLGLGLLAWALSTEGGGEVSGRALFAVAGAVVLVVFLVIETRTAQPMLDLGLFASRSFSAANLLTFFLYFSLSAILFFLPMTVISTWGVTEAEASAAFVPISVFIAALSAFSGRLADRFGPGPPIALGAALVAMAFAGLGATAPAQNFWGLVIPLMCLMGLGMALVVAPLSAAVMGDVAPDRTGAASGINNAVSRTSGLVAVAAMGGVAAAAYGMSGGPDSFGASRADAAHIAASTAAFATIAWITAALSAVSAGIAWVGIDRKRPAPAESTK
ncbi:MAG: MFS transporter [Rhodobacter sp.]|nr:MFS transporter [Rhodobacter sp.]